MVKDKFLTNQDGNTWQRPVQTGKDGDTVTRTVTDTNAKGETNTFTRSVTVDKPAE